MIQKFSGKAVDSEPAVDPSPVPSRANVELRRLDRSGRKAGRKCTGPREIERRHIIVEAVEVSVYLNRSWPCIRPYAPVVARAWTLFA